MYHLNSHSPVIHTLVQLPNSPWLSEQSPGFHTFSFIDCPASWISTPLLSLCPKATSFLHEEIASPLRSPVSVGNSLFPADTDFAYHVITPLTTLKNNYSACSPLCSNSLWIPRTQVLCLTHFCFSSNWNNTQHFLFIEWICSWYTR